MRLLEYDVAVVGAGPAGAAAALEAVRGGLRTVIVERRPIPRHKPCSGLVIPEARALIVESFGEPPASIFAQPGVYRAMRMHFPSGRAFDIPVDGWMVWRDRLDEWLCDRSKAHILDATAMGSFHEGRDGVALRCLRSDGEPVSIRCRAMIAADGGHSGVARTLDPSGHRALPWFMAIQETCELRRCDLEPGYFHFFTHPELAPYPAAYVKDGLLVADVGAPLGEKGIPRLDRFKGFLARHHGLEAGPRVRRMGCPITLAVPFGWSHFGTDRVLLAGEASGLLNPFGEGISSALASGLIAGRAATEGLGEPRGPGYLYRERVEGERRKTAHRFDPLRQVFATGDLDWKRGLGGLSIGGRLAALRDLGGWFREHGRELKRLRAAFPAGGAGSARTARARAVSPTPGA